MRPRLALILALIVLAPVGALGALAVSMAREDRAARARELDALLAARLDDVDAAVSRLLAERRRMLEELVRGAGRETAGLRQAVERSPIATAIFAREPDGRLSFPPLDSLHEREREFLRRAGTVLSGADSFSLPAEDGAPRTSGDWYTWYWDSGLQLLYWHAEGGRVMGAELDRTRLLADLVGVLPAGRTPADGRVVLSDARDLPVYQWGGYEPPAGAAPRVERALSPPLSSWRARYYLDPSVAASGPANLGALLGLAALGVALGFLAIYFYRASARELAEASERVSFVNHVSHELKTPLTNIRLYAELLERDLAGADPKLDRKLRVIVSESQRLSRLISNVLTFARQHKKSLELHAAPAIPDEVVEEVLTQFAPSLAERGIVVERALGARGLVRLDRDAFAQILANLIGNVEKYAASGAWLGVETAWKDGTLRLVVRDRGPGIPAKDRARVFEPFARLGAGVNEGVAGTGIGLTLARDLARLHGGEIVLSEVAAGACFVVTLRAQGAA